MKHFIALAVSYASAILAAAQSPTFDTAWQPANQPLLSEAVAVTTDDDGNIYTAGHFMGTGDFDPGPGTVPLSSASPGNYDVFVTKMDASGQLIWARNFGSAGHEWATAMVVDADGGVITCGRYNGIADMDPGPGVFNLDINGGEDIFVQKLDSDGRFVMAQRYGSGGFDAPYAMTQGPDGMIYLVGTFTGDQVPFGGHLLSTTPEFGVFDNYDGFIMKMDAEGAVHWAHRIGGNTYLDRVHDVAVDAAGNILFVGTFSTEEADFGPNAVDFGPDPVGLLDGFVCKWNANAGLQWLVQIGGQGDDLALAVTTDAAGNCYVTGTYDAACHTNVGGPGETLSTAGGRDIFVAQYDSEGNPGWARRIGGTGAEDVTDIALVAADRLVVSGAFNSVVDMDPGAGTVTRTSAGNTDLFLLGLATDGDYVWDIALGSSAADVANGLHRASDGDLLAVGRHGGIIDFDPGPGVHALNASANTAWAMRLGLCSPVVGAITTITACGAYTWNGDTYLTSGTYNALLTNNAGCDSTATLELTVVQLNDEVHVEGITLSAVQSGAAYQWVDCNNGNNAIAGATDQSYTAEVNGSYAVIVSAQDCAVMSGCIDIISTAMPEADARPFRVFPIPADDHLYIAGAARGSTVAVFDAQGRLVRSTQGTADPIVLDVRGVKPGTYMVRVHDGEGLHTVRIVVK